MSTTIGDLVDADKHWIKKLEQLRFQNLLDELEKCIDNPKETSRYILVYQTKGRTYFRVFTRKESLKQTLEDFVNNDKDIDCIDFIWDLEKMEKIDFRAEQTYVVEVSD